MAKDDLVKTEETNQKPPVSLPNNEVTQEECVFVSDGVYEYRSIKG